MPSSKARMDLPAPILSCEDSPCLLCCHSRLCPTSPVWNVSYSPHLSSHSYFHQHLRLQRRRARNALSESTLPTLFARLCRKRWSSLGHQLHRHPISLNYRPCRSRAYSLSSYPISPSANRQAKARLRYQMPIVALSSSPLSVDDLVPRLARKLSRTLSEIWHSAKPRLQPCSRACRQHLRYALPTLFVPY